MKQLLLIIILIGFSTVSNSQIVDYTYEEITERVDSVFNSAEEHNFDIGITYSKKQNGMSAYIKVENYSLKTTRTYFFKNGLKPGSRTYYLAFIRNVKNDWLPLKEDR